MATDLDRLDALDALDGAAPLAGGACFCSSPPWRRRIDSESRSSRAGRMLMISDGAWLTESWGVMADSASSAAAGLAGGALPVGALPVGTTRRG